MTTLQWVIVVVFVIVVAFAIYAINQAQRTPKVIVQSSAVQKADMWSVIDGVLGLLESKKKAKDEEEDPLFVGPPEASV